MIMAEKEVKTLPEELALAVDKEDVDELGFPRKRLTETQHEYVKKLRKRERGSTNGDGNSNSGSNSGTPIPIIKSVIFDKVWGNNKDPFGLKKDYELEVLDEPDNKWWHRWNAWLERKRIEEEARKKKAAEQAKLINETLKKEHQKQ